MLRKNDVVICDTRYWHRVFNLDSMFGPHFMIGVITKAEGLSDGFYKWADIGSGNDPWPFDKDELTKIGRI